MDSGYRAVGRLHDVDRHGCAVDFFTDGETPDAYRTAWSPGVFADSFRSHPHPDMVLDHMTGAANVIGRTVRAESLPDRARLVGTFEDFVRKPRARQAYEGILDGTYPGFSFWFTQAQGRALEGVRGGVRYVRARLEDWGPVRRPAIKGQRLLSIRSAPPGECEPVLSRLTAGQREGLVAAVERFAADQAVERDWARDWDLAAGFRDVSHVVDRIDRAMARRKAGM